ncbi:hypothetical protein HDV05_004394, partial [Chytridiales sp. JEL 0842]
MNIQASETLLEMKRQELELVRQGYAEITPGKSSAEIQSLWAAICSQSPMKELLISGCFYLEFARVDRAELETFAFLTERGGSYQSKTTGELNEKVLAAAEFQVVCLHKERNHVNVAALEKHAQKSTLSLPLGRRLHPLFMVNNFRLCYGMRTIYLKAIESSLTDWKAKADADSKRIVTRSASKNHLKFEDVEHVIIIPNFKEDIENLTETLDVLSSHRMSKTNYTVCLAMEELEKGSAEKARILMSAFAGQFKCLTHTIHPGNTPAESRGKSSNVNYAARALGKEITSDRRSKVIFTICDADSALAEDYFAAATYHYVVGTPEERMAMYFSTPMIFDRNANTVPNLVRAHDMLWSIGHLSHLYPESPVKFPVAVYSISMDLCVAVDFWDTGPEAIGEDMHMFVKCFFANGGLVPRALYSPSSQSNVEGTPLDQMKGHIYPWSSWLSGVSARYAQAKRHMWGSLDTGYSLHQTAKILANNLVTALMPSMGKKGSALLKLSGTKYFSILYLLYAITEAHVFLGHLLVLDNLFAIVVPSQYSLSYGISSYLWSTLFGGGPVSPVLESTKATTTLLRLACILPNILMIYYYEKYHAWVSTERWILQPAIDNNTSIPSSNGSVTPKKERLVRNPATSEMCSVQYLGKRALLTSERNWFSLLDWALAPIAAMIFYVGPQFEVQLSQLATNRLDYKVAAKPKAPGTPTTLSPMLKKKGTLNGCRWEESCFNIA